MKQFHESQTIIIAFLKRMVLVACVLLCAGCGEKSKMDTTNQYINQIKARRSAPIDPIPPVKNQERFIYKAQAMRSPFTPSVNENLASNHDGLSPDHSRPKEPLEAFPLDALKIVGMLSVGDSPWALISAPDSTIYRITLGNHLGQDYGKIIEISQSSIVIEEIVPNGVGGWRSKQRTLGLNQEAIK